MLQTSLSVHLAVRLNKRDATIDFACGDLMIAGWKYLCLKKNTVSSQMMLFKLYSICRNSHCTMLLCILEQTLSPSHLISFIIR